MTGSQVRRVALLLALTLSFAPQQDDPITKRFHAPTRLQDSLHTDLSDYGYPTDAGYTMTSVFADYRRTHFHGGIDISTGDDIGFRVFASRDGYVSRISVSPTGYGKTVWLKHSDGYCTTYNHLSGFNEAIEARVVSEQLRRERYPVLIEPTPTEFPVRKGDVIAFTGETGTGSPHLHFEIRDRIGDFVNPLHCREFSFQDDSIPRIRRIAITPLGEDSFVDGSYTTRVLRIDNPIRAAITARETLHASGRFGFAVDARDRINGSRFTSGVYSHRLFLDDSLIYAVTFDRAPSEDGHQIRLHYDYELMSAMEGRYEKLYKDSPSRLSFQWPPAATAGVVTTTSYRQGNHRFRIETRDFKGNSTEVAGTVVFAEPPVIQFTSRNSVISFDHAGNNVALHLRFLTASFHRRSKKSGWQEVNVALEQSALDLGRIPVPFDILKIEGRNNLGTPAFPRFVVRSTAKMPAAATELHHRTEADFVRVILRTSGVFTAEPTIALLEESTTTKLRPLQIDENVYTATFRPSEFLKGRRTVVAECEVNGRLQTLHDQFDIYHLLPGQTTTLSADGGNMILTADSFSVFRPTLLEVHKEYHKGEIHPAYSLLPRNTVMNRGVIVKLKADAKQSRQALYYRDRARGNWSLASRSQEDGYFVDTLARWFGDISVRQDMTPPTVSRLSTPTRWKRQPHVVSFRVGDNLSGVEYQELKLYIDRRFIVPAIDGEHRRVVNRLPVPLRRGTHSIRIILNDRIGNSNEFQKTFRVR